MNLREPKNGIIGANIPRQGIICCIKTAKFDWWSLIRDPFAELTN